MCGRQRRGARLGEQAPRGGLGLGRARERPAASDLAQLQAAAAGREVLLELIERLLDLVWLDGAGVGEIRRGHRLRRQEEQRLECADKLAHADILASRSDGAAGVIVISPNGSSWSQTASPCL